LRRAPLDSDVLLVHPQGKSCDSDASDVHGHAWQRYAAREGTLVVVRPDGYVLGRWTAPDWDALATSLPRLAHLAETATA
jgi:3-(3-hydroxy-phenyl)propionate hydroxylase